MARLTPHPAVPPAMALAIKGTATREATGLILLDIRLRGDVDAIRLPAPVAGGAGPVDGLWQATCFELFLAEPGADAYLEFNVSPSSAWAAYRFSGYRTGMAPLPLADPPRLTLRPVPGGLDASIVISVPDLPPVIQAALSVVIEDHAGARSFWALAHPAAQPDFHHRDCFVLQLGAAELP